MVAIVRPPVCADKARDVPKSQWGELLSERKTFCNNVIPSDCRMLLFFVDDAEKSKWLGLGSRERYLREGLGLDPDQVEWAVQGLKTLEPNKPVEYEWAQQLGKHGGDRRSDAVKDQGCNATLKRGTRAYTLARLKRDRPDLAQKVIDGELSAHAAAIKAGFRKKLTPFEQVVKLWPKLSVAEKKKIRKMP